MITLEEYSQRILAPACIRTLQDFAQRQNFTQQQTQALVDRFNADPIAVSEELFGNWSD